MSTTKPADLRLAYLVISSPVPNVFLGGIMVTDGRGLPVEFRYTEPIQPTRIQQILYGQVLSTYIKREVILETLLKSIENKFKCLLVEDEQLVNIPTKGYTIIRMSETKAPPLGGLGQIEKITEAELLLQASQQGSPIRLHFTSAPLTPMALGSPESVGESASQQAPFSTLVEAGQSMDVFEPMKRIQKALEIICQETGITSANN